MNIVSDHHCQCSIPMISNLFAMHCLVYYLGCLLFFQIKYTKMRIFFATGNKIQTKLNSNCKFDTKLGKFTHRLLPFTVIHSLLYDVIRELHELREKALRFICSLLISASFLLFLYCK